MAAATPTPLSADLEHGLGRADVRCSVRGCPVPMHAQRDRAADHRLGDGLLGRFGGACLVHQAPGAHHGDIGRDGHDLRQLVRDDQDGLALLREGPQVREEAAGLLRREACASDRRGYHAVLTADGQALLRRMWPVYAGVLREALVATLEEEEAEALAEALGRLSAR